MTRPREKRVPPDPSGPEALRARRIARLRRIAEQQLAGLARDIGKRRALNLR